MTSCRWINNYQSFGEVSCLHFQVSSSPRRRKKGCRFCYVNGNSGLTTIENFVSSLKLFREDVNAYYCCSGRGALGTCICSYARFHVSTRAICNLHSKCTRCHQPVIMKQPIYAIRKSARTLCSEQIKYVTLKQMNDEQVFHVQHA